MIKLKNLDPSLIGWIMNKTQLGPGIGEIFYVASTSGNYYQRLLDEGNVGEANIFTLPSAALAAATASRNDVILITPGAYAETSEVAWSKDFTHAIGLAGDRCWSDYSEPGVSIYTTTAAVAETVDLTGDYCQFHGINFSNNGANSGNLAAFNVDGYMATFKGCSFMGVMNSTQNAVAAAGALYIDGLGSNALFEDCQIGDNNWVTRSTANSGQLCYVSTAGYPAPQLCVYRRCRFVIKSVTATVALVRLAHLYSIDNLHLFDNCVFHNVYTNWGGNLNQVFYNPNVQTATIFLKDCAMSGFDEWQDSDYYTLYQSNMGVATAGGGICIEPTATIS